jgi:hypothetical protein
MTATPFCAWLRNCERAWTAWSIYWEVSDPQVHEILKTRLGDFPRLLELLSDYFGWKKNSGPET